MTELQHQDTARHDEALEAELPEHVRLQTDEGRRLAEQLADDEVRHARKLLEVRGLKTRFYTRDGVIHAVDGVDFDLGYGETLGLVGESGCGKSITALSLVRLVPEPTGRIVEGEIIFDGVDILKLAAQEMRLLRGKSIGFIFQDPLTSLNPTRTIGFQIAESARTHLGLSKRAADDRAVELLSKVGIPRARERLTAYPFEFSGGMRQRVMIASALACDPKLLIADEPTTALDVTIQAQILELIRSLSDEFGTAVLLITHDLGIAAGMCDRINVMYAGQIVETANIDDLFERPQMPYSWGLLGSLPRMDMPKSSRLRTIEGMPHNLINPPDECRFAPRCEYVRDVCLAAGPQLNPRREARHEARCWGTDREGWIS